MEEDGSDKRKREAQAGEKELPPKKRANFNLHTRQLFLTYPQCDISKEDALLQLSEKVGNPDEYLIAQEEHQVRKRAQRNMVGVRWENLKGTVAYMTATDYVAAATQHAACLNKTDETIYDM